MEAPEAGRAQFDDRAFFAAIDRVRDSRGMNWRQVASDSGVSASTLTRLAQGRRPDVDSLAALVDWAGLDADAFICRTGTPDGPTDPIGRISAHLRADRSLSPEVAEALEALVVATYKAMQTGHK